MTMVIDDEKASSEVKISGVETKIDKTTAEAQVKAKKTEKKEGTQP
jgi:hypothetical protein